MTRPATVWVSRLRCSVIAPSNSEDLLRAGRRVEFTIDNGHYRNVWSAAELQAENRDDGLVCANVFGLWWSQRLLAMMDSARPLPY